MVDGALGLQDAAREATPVPADSAASGVDDAVAREMASVHQRLLGNSCFRAIDALVMLAAFRLSAMLEWLPWMAAFVTAALMDGAIGRVVKSKEFRQHDPELFALNICGAIVMSCATVVGFVAPFTLHPLTMPNVLLVISLLLSRAVGSFHRRG